MIVIAQDGTAWQPARKEEAPAPQRRGFQVEQQVEQMAVWLYATETFGAGCSRPIR